MKDGQYARNQIYVHTQGRALYSLSSPKNRCPVSTLDSNVALPVYRTFMAHKYQELSMISLLYYQKTLTNAGEAECGMNARGQQRENCYLAQFQISCPTPIPRWNSRVSGQLRPDVGFPPIEPGSRGNNFLSALRNYTARAQIQSTVRCTSFFFFFFSLFPPRIERKAKTIASWSSVSLQQSESRIEL